MTSVRRWVVCGDLPAKVECHERSLRKTRVTDDAQGRKRIREIYALVELHRHDFKIQPEHVSYMLADLGVLPVAGEACRVEAVGVQIDVDAGMACA